MYKLLNVMLNDLCYNNKKSKQVNLEACVGNTDEIMENHRKSKKK